MSIIKCKVYSIHFWHSNMKLALHSTFTHSFCTMIEEGKMNDFSFIVIITCDLLSGLIIFNKLYEILNTKDNTYHQIVMIITL